MPLIHVLVVTWKGRSHLEECLESLFAQTFKHLRIVLLDNASGDGSLEFVRSRYGDHPLLDIVPLDRNRGWSGANNAGIAGALDAGADYVFLLNDDTVTAPGAVTALVDQAERNPELGAIAPKMLLYDAPYLLNSLGLECSLIGAGWDRGIGRLDGPHWDTPCPVIGGCGGALFIRCAALRKTGLLPEDFGIYLDDLDLCMRIWNAGYAIHTCPAAVVRHKFSATMAQGKNARTKYYLNTRNRYRLILRNFPLAKMPRVLPLLALAEARAIGSALLRLEFWRAGAHVRARLAAVCYVPTALRHRAQMKRAGLDACRFWPFVRRRPLFFPGVPFPKDGWYPERMLDGTPMRPISARATLRVREGRLRLVHANCYPHCGSTDVDVIFDGAPIARLRTGSVEETAIDIPGSGEVLFESRHVFMAEDTGEPIDIGGWIHAVQDPSPEEDGSTAVP